MIDLPYTFLDELMLRCPLYNYESYSLEKIAEITRYPAFQTALYLASPQLYHVLATKNFDFGLLRRNEQLSIVRYYNRMSFRPTPFGAFSSFTLTRWGITKEVRISEENRSLLHLSIDQDILLRFSELTTQATLDKQLFTPTPSLYEWKRDFRFIKTELSENQKNISFLLESIENNPLTSSVFNFCYRKHRLGSEIVKFMVGTANCDDATARGYLEFLIDAQLLINPGTINMIGQDYTKRLSFAGTGNALPLSDTLTTGANKSFPGIGQMLKISSEIGQSFNLKNDDLFKQHFYAGLERPLISGCLSESYQQDILNGLVAISLLVPAEQPPALSEFILNFQAKYDKQKIALMEALDPDVGIGYGVDTDTIVESELLDRLDFTDRKTNGTTLEWGAAHQLLLKKWIENKHHTDPILLTEEDLAMLPVTNDLVPPPTLGVLFRITESYLYLENAGGATATSLIGRFNSWSEATHSLARRLADIEQNANPHVIFADIGQLSEPHADNINRREHIYPYETPINVISTLPFENQVLLSDLVISVIGGKLLLESQALKKTVVPRLSSAYNYTRNSLAVFRFLCDLQSQGIRSSYHFTPEHYFPGLSHYPRVVYKKTILSPATWYLSKTDIAAITSGTLSVQTSKFKVLRNDKKLPALVATSEFDRQLVFDLDKEADVSFLLECIKGQASVTLQEFFAPANIVVSGNGNSPLVNQFVSFLYHKKEIYGAPELAEPDKMVKTVSSYALGSKWLYLKIYCSPALSNDILVKKILPLLLQCKPADLNSWFFIRYRDSCYHIRLRLRVNETFIGTLIVKLKKRLADHIRFKVIREYQADTYRREIERYGADIMALVEDFFYGSSMLVLHYLKAHSRKSFPYSYHSLAFVSVSQLIDRFITGIDDRIVFLDRMVVMFYSEFSSDKALKIGLDQKYREIKSEINELVSVPGYYDKAGLSEWADLFISKVDTILKRTEKFTTKRKNQILADLIHMHLNRLFVDKQRHHELVVYYCLYKNKVSARAVKR